MVVYKTTNLVNGKIYVGKDSKNNPKYLGSGVILEKAIIKYGKENFKKEILSVCSGHDELNEKEKYWIKELRSQDRKVGYNLTGGTGMFGYHHTEKTKDKYRELFSIKIYQYDLEGNFIKEHRSAKTASSDTKIERTIIESNCHNYSRVAGGYVWSYKLLTEKECNDIKEEFIRMPYINNKAKQVFQYDLKGNFIGVYKNLSIAAKETGVNINSIIFNYKGYRNSGGSFIWSNIELNKKELSEKIGKAKNKKRTNKQVLQYDTNNEFIKEYDSMKLAANITNTNESSLCSCCKGYQKTAGGFIWKYKKKL